MCLICSPILFGAAAFRQLLLFLCLSFCRKNFKINFMNNLTTKQALLDALYAYYTDSPALLIQDGSYRIIFGEGDINARLMLIGEAPGAKEDELMRPFVGRSGQLLNRLLKDAGTSREETFITNIVKVRPPNNRKPTPKEIERGRELLLKQIEIIQPQVICTLGASSLEGLLGRKAPISELRGTLLPFHNTLVIPAFHPAYVLRDMKKLPILLSDLLLAVKTALERA